MFFYICFIYVDEDDQIDRNMSKLWAIVCKNMICTLVYLLVLLYEMLSQNTETPSQLIPYSQ